MQSLDRGPPDPPSSVTSPNALSGIGTRIHKQPKERVMRLSSSDEAVALVQQEMSNLKALKRLSIGAMMSPLDPDLPGFTALPDSYSPDKRQQPPVETSPELPPTEADSAGNPLLRRSSSEHRDQHTTSRRLNIDSQEAHDLIWVPARLHPEIAPNEWRSFVENRVREIKNNVEHQSKSSASESGSSNSASRLSHEIADSADLMDASDVLERRRRSSTPVDTRRLSILELSTQLKSLGELESLAALSGSFSSSDDQPWSPPPEDNFDQPLSPGASLRRSGGSSRRRTRPTIRRKPAQDGENNSPPVTPTSSSPPDVPLQSPERQELRNRVTKATPIVTDTSPRPFIDYHEEHIYKDPVSFSSEPAYQPLVSQDTTTSSPQSPQSQPERVFHGTSSPSKPTRPTGLTIDVGKNPHQSVEFEEKKNKPLWRWLKQDKEKDKDYEKDKDHEKDSTVAPQSPTTQMFSKMFKKKKKEPQAVPHPPPSQPPVPSSTPEPSTQIEQKQQWSSTASPSRPGHSRQRSRTANYACIEGVRDSTEQRMPDTTKSRSPTLAARNPQIHPDKQRGSNWKKPRQREIQERDQEDSNRNQRPEKGEPGAVVQPIQLPYEIPPHQLSDRSNIMMYHRFPLHIERAIYRLSHMKLANPRRPLSQQVLLSNFMYAYLNLINQGYQRQMEAAASAGSASPEGENSEGSAPGEEVNDESQSEYDYDGYASYDVSYMQSSEIVPDGQYYEQHEEYEAPTDFEFFQGQSSSSSESDASEEMNEMWDEQDHEYQQPLMA